LHYFASVFENIVNFFNNLYKYLVGLAAILAVIEIIWGGLEYSTQDSVSKQSDGKERIYGAIMGLILVLSPVLVFSIINPSILNLSLNLPEIKPVAEGSGVTKQVDPDTAIKSATAAASVQGCSVVDSTDNFIAKEILCPNTFTGMRAAQAFAAKCPGANRVFTDFGSPGGYRATCAKPKETPNTAPAITPSDMNITP
jgi:hypothetical protein